MSKLILAKPPLDAVAAGVGYGIYAGYSALTVAGAAAVVKKAVEEDPFEGPISGCENSLESTFDTFMSSQNFVFKHPFKASPVPVPGTELASLQLQLNF